MSGLVPFNRKNRNLVNFDNFGGFYNMFDDFFSDWPSPRNFARNTFKLDVQENDEEYIVEAELPGVDKDEINIEMNDGRLNISIKREERVDEKQKNYIHKERRYSSMSRSIYLDGAKSQGIKAKLENGLLSIKIPKESKANNSIKINID